MAVPTWTIGQVLTASDVNTWFVPLVAWKSALLTRSTNTLALDPDLQFTAAASASYEVHVAINYSVSVGGFQWNFAVPAGVTGAYTGAVVLGGTGAGAFGWTWTSSNQAGNQVSPNGGILITGVLNTAGTGGGVGLQWANGTGANSTTIGANSMIAARRIG